MHRDAVITIKKIFDVLLKEEDLRVEKARIYFDASRFDDAEKLCKSIIADPVSNTEKQKAQKILARVYEGKGKVDEALQMYTDISPYERDENVKMSLARLYDKKGDSGNALRYLSLLKDKKIRSEEIEKRLRKLIGARDPKADEYLIKFSLSIDKDSLFLVTAARYLIEDGKKFEGTSMLRRAMSGLERGEAYLSMAGMLLKEGKYSEAMKNVTPLLLENRYFIRASFIMAEILSAEGDLDGAIACMEKTEKYSKDARITSMIADLYLKKGDRDAAFKYYKISSDRGDAIAALKTGDLLYLSGKASQSGAYYKRSLSLGLSDEKSRQWAYYQYGKMTGDKKYLKKAEHSGGVIGEAAVILEGSK
jgi:tetratricopeptide (TPR) repeat protein